MNQAFKGSLIQNLNKDMIHSLLHLLKNKRNSSQIIRDKETISNKIKIKLAFSIIIL